VSHEQVVKGLLGAVVVTPKAGVGADVDVLGLAHLYSGRRTVQGRVGDVSATAAPGQSARVRVVNTDAGIMPVWVSGSSFEVVAVDGVDLHGPTPVSGKKVLVPGGGRVDLRVRVPAGGGAVRVEMGGAALVVGPAGSTSAATRAPREAVDLLGYGTPAPLDFDPTRPDRRFDYGIGRRPGFVNGRPGVQWTINGRLFPAVPMFMVAEGDVVVVRLDNHSGETHPMHLHGHHVLVLARDGVRSTGSPWWTDSLEVGSGETVEVAFVADNPGIWMDHCHNLPHAREGLVAHLMYEGVTTRFRLGRDTPNSPE
jgi:FtsP/CotA-like multicopper oxidase with cupredoxin domain